MKINTPVAVSFDSANNEQELDEIIADGFRSINTPVEVTQTDVSKPTSNKKVKRRMIGNYYIDKDIGEGTFGKVRLGTHKLTQENVAIKVLEKSRITDVTDVERVTREIHILKMIRHPNIC